MLPVASSPHTPHQHTCPHTFATLPCACVPPLTPAVLQPAPHQRCDRCAGARPPPGQHRRTAAGRQAPAAVPGVCVCVRVCVCARACALVRCAVVPPRGCAVSPQLALRDHRICTHTPPWRLTHPRCVCVCVCVCVRARVCVCARARACVRAQSCVFLKEPGYAETNWHSDLRMAPLDCNHFVTAWMPLRPVQGGEQDSGCVGGWCMGPCRAVVWRWRMPFTRATARQLPRTRMSACWCALPARPGAGVRRTTTLASRLVSSPCPPACAPPRPRVRTRAGSCLLSARTAISRCPSGTTSKGATSATAATRSRTQV
jgi:hypothetical protein